MVLTSLKAATPVAAAMLCDRKMMDMQKATSVICLARLARIVSSRYVDERRRRHPRNQRRGVERV